MPSRNYFFSAPAPPLSITTATAPAPAPAPVIQDIDSSTIRNILASFNLTTVNIYLKDNFGSGSSSQLNSAPPAPAPQHWS